MHLIYLFRIIAQVLSNFVAQVCIGVFIAHNFHRIVYPYRAVICGKNHLVAQFGKPAEDVDG